MKWILPFLVVVAGMLGGQIWKAYRQAGIPLTAFIAAIFNKNDKAKERWKKAGLLLVFVACLALGYGEHSWLRKHVKYEWLCRFIWASFFAIPFLAFRMWYAWPILVVAKQVRAGGFKVGKYDFLIEDFCFYLTLGVMVSLLIYKT